MYKPARRSRSELTVIQHFVVEDSSLTPPGQFVVMLTTLLWELNIYGITEVGMFNLYYSRNVLTQIAGWSSEIWQNCSISAEKTQEKHSCESSAL